MSETSATGDTENLKIVYWGTYDLGKPRNRILLRGLRENHVEVIECHTDVWRGVEDKSRILGWMRKFLFFWTWFKSYPGLICRYWQLSRHDAVVVGYLGHLDVLIIWPFAKFRGVPVVWDAFISLYDTIVCDRCLVGRLHPLALVIYAWEWLACKAADRIVLDTRAHADFFTNLYGLPEKKMQVALVGAEPEMFAPSRTALDQHEKGLQHIVLFYGQFIPLHGIETIVQAARELQNDQVCFILIGKGQEEQKIRDILAQHPLKNLKWIQWVEYKNLVDWIHKADVCLGIFGETAKASRVIPNKVFQVVAAGKPLITRESPAIRELFSSGTDPVALVSAGDPIGLAEEIKKMIHRPLVRTGNYTDAVRARIMPQAIGKQMKCILEEAVASFKQ
jgi:glycosyltransferase involved in cell wall biosynthesis